MKTLPAGTVRDRLATIIESCGYPSLAELGDELGLNSRAVISSWQTRNSYGNEGAALLHDKTGADINWLMGRGDVPFPTGPKINPALNTAGLYGHIRDLRKIILEFAFSLAQTTPGLASEWRQRLDGGSVKENAENTFRGLLLVALENPQAVVAAANNHAQTSQSHAKRGRRKQK